MIKVQIESNNFGIYFLKVDGYSKTEACVALTLFVRTLLREMVEFATRVKTEAPREGELMYSAMPIQCCEYRVLSKALLAGLEALQEEYPKDVCLTIDNLDHTR